MVSLAPPPVAPTLRLPPGLIVPVEGGLDLAVPPPPPPLLEPLAAAAGGEQPAGGQHRAARQGAVQHLAPCQSVACLFVRKLVISHPRLSSLWLSVWTRLSALVRRSAYRVASSSSRLTVSSR